MTSLSISNNLFAKDHRVGRTRPTKPPSPANHGATYYLSCFVAGGMSSSIRWALSPLELAKMRSQATVTPGTNTSVVGTLYHVYAAEGLGGWFRGLVPTAAAYGIQTSMKYGCYEVFKDQLHHSLHLDEDYRPDRSGSRSSLIYVISAASAEAIADVFMCPFEMIKAQMQTNPNFPRTLKPAPERNVASPSQLSLWISRTTLGSTSTRNDCELFCL